MPEQGADREATRVLHHDFAPANWFQDRSKSSIWITAYRAFNLKNEEQLATHPVLLDLVQARVRAHWYVGTLRHTDFRAARMERVGADAAGVEYRLDVSRVRELDEPTGVYLILITPFALEGAVGDEAHVRERLAAVLGLICTFEGRNAAFEQVFEHVYHFGTGLTSGWSPPMPNPAAYGAPDLSEGRLAQIAAAETKIERLEVGMRNRVRLALKWEWDATNDSGIDAYLKHWIALETLAMPDTTNIEPLVGTVAAANMPMSEAAKDRFAIGRIYGLRGDIVHRGWSGAIHSDLLDHLANLFNDALTVTLGLTSEGRAERSFAAARASLGIV